MVEFAGLPVPLTSIGRRAGLGVDEFHKRLYFSPTKIWEIVREMLVSWEMMKRRLQEGVEFFRYLRARKA